MPLTITNIQAVLKKIIAPTVMNLLRNEAMLYEKIKKNVGVSVINNKIYIASRTGRHSGIYSVAEGAEPRSGKAKYEQPVADVKYAFGTLEITDQAIEAASAGNVKAIASILTTEIEALKDDIKMDLNRQFHGAGTGKLCLANGSGSNTTALVVDGCPGAALDGTEYLAEGMYIVIGTGAAVQISSINSDTSVTLAEARTWANDDVIKKADADEMMGLAGIIDDGDNVAVFQNITRSASPWAKAFTDDTSAVLTEAQMINIYLKTLRFGGGKVWLMGETLFSKYGQLLTSMKKTADLKEVLSGGWQGLQFMGGKVGVMLDPDTWDTYAQLVDFDSLTLAELTKPFQWLEADAHGGILKRSSTNRTVWEGTMKYYANLVARKFKSNARLSAKTPT